MDAQPQLAQLLADANAQCRRHAEACQRHCRDSPAGERDQRRRPALLPRPLVAGGHQRGKVADVRARQLDVGAGVTLGRAPFHGVVTDRKCERQRLRRPGNLGEQIARAAQDERRARIGRKPQRGLCAPQIGEHDVAAPAHPDVVARVLRAGLRRRGAGRRPDRRVPEGFRQRDLSVAIGVRRAPQSQLEMVGEEAAADGGALLRGLPGGARGDERRSLHLVRRQREIDRGREAGALRLRQPARVAGVHHRDARIRRAGVDQSAELVVAQPRIAELQPGSSCVSRVVEKEQRPFAGRLRLQDAPVQRGDRRSHFVGAPAAQDHDVLLREVAQFAHGARHALRVAFGEPQPRSALSPLVVAGDHREALRRPGGGGGEQRGHGGKHLHGVFSIKRDACGP